MKTEPSKPKLDTPHDGDFAAYVERLTAAAPSPAATMSSFTAPVPPLSSASPASLPETGTAGRSGRSRQTGQSDPSSPAAPSDPAPLRTGPSPGLAGILEPLLPLQALLRPARQVVLVLIALQAVALFGFSQGSFMGILTLAVVWWALGQLGLALARLSPAGEAAAIDPEALREGFRRLAAHLKSKARK
jgi:hypothetical protein